MADQFSAQIDVDISEESLRRMEQAVVDALSNVQKPMLDRMDALLKQFSFKMARDLKKAADKQDELNQAVKNYAKFASQGDKAALGFTAQITKLTDAVGTQIAAINKAASANRDASNQIQRDMVSQRIKLDRERQIDLENLRQSGKLAAVQEQRNGNLQLVAARQSAKQRVQITRFALETIGRLEKGLGSLLSGVARTTASALSRSASAVGSLITRQNREYTSSTGAALSRRERLIQESFSRQERSISVSISRSTQQIENLRREMNTGVVGVVNRAGLGTLAAGAGVAGALASTFTIGADFTRGLAVLRAQLDLTATQMADVRQLSIDLGNDISLPGVSALDAAQAIQLLSKQFASLGPGAVTAASSAAKGTLQLARAANVSAEEAAQVVGSAVNVFGVAASKATEVADSVAAALKNAAGVSFSDFSDAFRQGASVFAQFEVPALGAEEALTAFNAALAALAKNGVLGSDAGTSLKQFFLQANRGSQDSIAAMATLTERAGETGTAFYDAAGKARPFEETLDILRRGLAGLTDEQRNSTLETIFGSDAVRSANALLGISTEEYAKLTDQVREQGLAAKIAAAQNSGLKGALDAAKSVLETVQILLFEKVNKALGEFVLTLTSAVNTLLFSDGAWAVVRKGLLGVAGGLAAIVAAKGAIELFKVLAGSARLLLTPFGAIATIAGVVGGAIYLMTQRSEPLRKALGELRDRFGDLVDNLKAKAQPILEAVARFVTDVLVPAFDAAANWLGNHLVGALDATISFITGTAVPAIVGFARTIFGWATPAIKEVVGWLESLYSVVADKVVAAFNVVQPYLQPTIDGFKSLGSAIAGAFHGDFGGLGSGFGSLFNGIGDSVSMFADKVLIPTGKRVLRFLQGLFTRDNMLKVAKGFLSVVEEIGRILGSLVSDPRFLAAIAAIAAAGVIVAARFLEGFAKGIWSNVGPVLKAVPGLLAKVLFDPSVLIPALLGVFAAATILPAIKARFTAIGAAASSALKNGASTGSGGTDFIRTLFGGDNAALKTWSDRIDAEVTRTITNVQNRLRVLGSKMIVDKGNLDAAKKELKQLEDAFTGPQKRALEMRDRISGAVRAVGALSFGGSGLLAGLKELGKGFANLDGGDFTTNFRNAFKNIKAGFSVMMSELKSIAKQQGVSIGQALSFGAQAALVGVGGFLAGRAEGSAGGSGGMSALTAGLTGLAVGGPVVGAAAAGLALIGASMGKADAAAKKLEEQVAQTTDTIIVKMKEAGLAVADFSFAVNALGEDGFGNLLTPDLKKKLLSLGIDFQDLRKIVAASGGDIRTALTGVFDAVNGGATGENAPSTGVLTAQDWKVLGDAIQVVADGLAAANVDAEFFATHLDDARAVANSIFGAFGSGPGRPDLSWLRQGAEFVLQMSSQRQPTAIDAVNTALDGAIGRLATANTSLSEFLNPPGDTSLQRVLDQQILAVAGTGTNIQQGRAAGTDTGAASARQSQRAISDAMSTAIQAGIDEGFTSPSALQFITAGILRASLEGVTDQSLIDEITSTYNTAIANAQPLIDAAAAAGSAQKYQASFQEFLTNNPLLAEVDPKIAKTAFEAVGRDTKKLGEDIVQGLIDGIDAKEVLALAKAEALTRGIMARIANVAQVRSPSRVTMEIGRFIGEGLAIGLEESTTNLGDVAAKAIDDAIAKATEAATRGRDALAQVGASLFGMSTGLGASVTFGSGGLGLGDAQAGITTSQNQFFDQFRATVDAIFAAAAKQLAGQEALTSAEQALIGANPFSLDPTNTVGVNNRASFLSALDAIATMGDEMLAAGSPLQAVIDKVITLREALIGQAAGLGFNVDAMRQLTDALGISNDALQRLSDTAAGAAAGLDAATAAAAVGAQAGQSGLGVNIADVISAGSTGADFLRWLTDMVGDPTQVLGGLDPAWVAALDNQGLVELLTNWAGAVQYATEAATNMADTIDAHVAQINRDIPVYNRTPNTGGITTGVVGGSSVNNVFHMYLPTGDPAANALAVANRIAQIATPPR